MAYVLRASTEGLVWGPQRHVRLNMIVKDEAHCIKRCLDSIRPYIDSWSIVDTGSRDGTQNIIRECLKDIPGSLQERPWIDFSTNRNEALAYARQMGRDAYALFIDADEEFSGTLAHLGSDPFYTTTVVWEGKEFPRVVACRLDREFFWMGHVHEQLRTTDDTIGDPVKLKDSSIISHNDGGRHKEEGWAERDADIIIKDLNTPGMGDIGTLFLAAGTLEAAQRLELALGFFALYVRLSDDSEARWYAAMRVANIKWVLRHARVDVLQAYMDAVESRPSRAEGWRDMADFLARHGNFEAANKANAYADELPMTTDTLFVNKRAYKVAV